jgi:hypothetical protein
MISYRQIEANHRNALRRRAKTEVGNQVSRCNAVRHGHGAPHQWKPDCSRSKPNSCVTIGKTGTCIHAAFPRPDSISALADSRNTERGIETMPDSGMKANAPDLEFARCFLRLANLPNFALDRLSRYEATLWRQAGRILYALETLARANAPFLAWERK